MISHDVTWVADLGESRDGKNSEEEGQQRLLSEVSIKLPVEQS